MCAKKVSTDKFVRGFKKESERLALKAREDLGLEAHSYLSGRLLAEHHNIPILSPRDIPGLSRKDIEVLLGAVKKTRWSAVTIEHDCGSKFILLNDSHSIARQESDIMHELAHVIRCHEMSVVDNRQNFPFVLRDYDNNNEREAIWLGGCLQIPRAGLFWAAKNDMQLEEIADHFKCSKQMVTYRLNIEGILRQFRNYNPRRN
jgi:Zn-dependent peptidase ImmA (M78 family)